MIDNLKALGLAAVAVFAMSAVAASAASAQANGKLTSDGPVTLVGTQIAGGSTNNLTAFITNIQCGGATYTGHKYNATPHQLIASGASYLTLTPHYGACTALGFPATIDMNGCDFQIEIGETSFIFNDRYGSWTMIVCPVNKHIEVTVFTGASHAIRACTMTITENATGYVGLEVIDTTEGRVDLSGTLTGIGIVVHRSGFGCSTETDTDADWHLSIRTEGRNSKGEATPISLSHN